MAKEPGSHCVQAVACGSLLNVPLSQIKHELLPGWFCEKPGLQSTHDELPLCGAARPATHDWQAPRPHEPANVPAKHFLHVD